MRPTVEAAQKAEALFLSLLTPDEREEWYCFGRVTLTGSEGGVYELYTAGTVDNVRQIDPETRKKVATLCCAPNMWPTRSRTHIPIPDAWVGQLLALRYNEKEFRRTAVVSYPCSCCP